MITPENCNHNVVSLFLYPSSALPVVKYQERRNVQGSITPQKGDGAFWIIQQRKSRGIPLL